MALPDKPNHHQNQTFDSSRRLLLKGGVAALMLPLLQGLAVPEAAAVSKGTFDAFLRFSREVTGYHDLDRGMVEQLIAVFEAEPWGMDHLKRVRNKLAKAASPAEALPTLDEGEHWFLGHFLDAWITGIYYHGSGNKTISFEHALMYDAFRDLRPVPGFSDRKFGFWSEAPTSKGERA
jgi:hypothetical protein